MEPAPQRLTSPPWLPTRRFAPGGIECGRSRRTYILRLFFLRPVRIVYSIVSFFSWVERVCQGTTCYGENWSSRSFRRRIVVASAGREVTSLPDRCIARREKTRKK